MIETAQVTGGWVEITDPSMGYGFKAAVGADYPALTRVQDVTGVYSDTDVNNQNLVTSKAVIHRVIGETAVIDAIEADVKYVVLHRDEL